MGRSEGVGSAAGQGKDSSQRKVPVRVVRVTGLLFTKQNGGSKGECGSKSHWGAGRRKAP